MAHTIEAVVSGGLASVLHVHFYESAADTYGPRLAEILLSGAEDGARGLAAIRDGGGATVVQAPETSMAHTVPDAVVRVGAAGQALPTREVGAWLTRLALRTERTNDAP